MYTKLRPGVREFLTQASRYFQLWIHTNGAPQGRWWEGAWLQLQQMHAAGEAGCGDGAVGR